MTLDVFQQSVNRTLADLGDNHYNLSHMLIGMNSELIELKRASDLEDFVGISEEMADILFYVAGWCTFRGIAFESLLEDKRHPKDDYLFSISNLAGVYKKHLAYKKEMDSDVELNILKDIFNSIKDDYSALGIDMYQSLEKVINKLKERFPDKFSEELALHKDAEKERQILEKND